MSTQTYLRIYEGETLLGVKQFDQDQIVIGRNATVNIDLQHEDVSPIHAMIEKRGDSFYVCDLGSEKGTLKNGSKIIDIHLDSGDALSVGPYQLEFYVGQPKPEMLPPEVAESSTGSVPAAPGVSTPEVAFGDQVPVPAAEESSNEPVAKIPSSMTPKKEKGKTFAPPSENRSVAELLGLSKGNVVEVVVAWQERVIDTFSFSNNKKVILGGHEQCDIYLPIFGNNNIEHTLLEIGPKTTVYLTPTMTGELITESRSQSFNDLIRLGKMAQKGVEYAFALGQGETLRIDMPNETVTLYIRYVPQSPKPILAPILDLNLPELVSMVMAVFISVFLSFYVSIRVPQDQALIDLNKKRTAQILYKVPFEPPPPPPPPVKEEPKKIAQLPPVRTMVKKSEEPKKPVVQEPQKRATPRPNKKEEGRSAQIRPKNLPKAPKKVTSIRRGGKKKITKKPGASAATKKKDISKVGILGVFGQSGIRDKIDQTASGAGVLQGLAERATGGAGEETDLLGEGIGTELLDTGAGGEGVATVGIDNVGTKGRGSGDAGYGTGGSLGVKKSVQVQLGDDESDFIGKIDREAIKRVVLAHIREIRRCYERQLNRQPELEGKIVLQWTIGDRGLVAQPKVRSTTMNSRPVESCLITRLRTWRFPEPPAGMQAEVSYPFLFASQK